VRAADEIPGLAAYWALVEESRQAIAGLAGQPEQEVRTRLLALAGRWEALQQIRLEDGAGTPVVLNIDNSFWVSQFRAEKPDLQHLLISMDSLLAAHSLPKMKPADSNTTALHEILSRPEFQWQQQEAPNWIQDLIDRFQKWLSRLFGQTPAITAPGDQALQIFGGVAALLVMLVLIYVLRGLFTDLTVDAFLNTEKDAQDVPLNAQSALARAEGLSDQGDYRLAVRYLYLSALLILDERGLLYYDRTRTNREYLRDLAARPQTASLLRAVIDVFDRVWYGFQALDAETYQRYAEQVNELKEKNER